MPAIHIKGSPGASQRVFSYRDVDTRETTSFYPERGIITIHYEGRNGAEEYKRLPRRDFLLRARATLNEVRWLRDHKRFAEADRKQRLVDTMVAAARAAGDQGDPFLPKHLDDIVKQRASTSVAVITGGRDWETHMPPIPTAPADAPLGRQLLP